VDQCQFLAFDDQEVLDIRGLCGFGKVEAACYHCVSLNDDNLVVGYGVSGVNECWYLGIG